MLLSFIKEIFTFTIIAIAFTVVFVFTNCGEESEFSDEDLQMRNYVFLSYTDKHGKDHLRKTEFFETDNDIYVDGDILIGSAESISIGQVIKLNNAVDRQEEVNQSGDRVFYGLKSDRALQWENSIVPFAIDSSVSDENYDILVALITEFNEILLENKVSLQFKAKTTQRDFISFVERDLNFPMAGQSYIGRIGGKQTLKIRQDSFKRIIVHHEILHALGFKHEHQRSDRQIQINLANVNPQMRFNFAVYDSGAGIGKYDIKSILHYHSFAFSENNQPSMLTKHGEIINRNFELSAGDIFSLKAVYGSTQVLPDGIYTYENKTYRVEAGKYCILDIHSLDGKIANISQMLLNSILNKGLQPGLARSPYCN